MVTKTAPAAKPAPARPKRAAPEFPVRKVGGVRLLSAKAPGLKQLVLAFRVGMADEQLAERGLSHCCEHLALRQFRDATFEYNGFVDSTRTVFYARGTDAQLVEFARGVTTALSALPEEDYANERRVLQAESARRQVGDLQLLLRLRYGSTGPGASAYAEYGLYEDDVESVHRWSRRWFTAANAVAWCSGPVPRGLRFELEAGEPLAVPTYPELDEPRPTFLRRNGGVALGTITSGDPLETFATFVLQRRLLRRLRHELGATYAVEADLSRIGLDLGHFSLHADVGPNQAQLVTDELFAVGRELSATGHTTAELDEWIAFRDQAALHGEVSLDRLDSAAQRVLFGGTPRSTPEWQAAIERASAAQVATAAEHLLGRAIHLLPQAASTPVHLAPIASSSPRSVTGRTHSPAAGGVERLTVGSDGVTWKGQDATVTVEADGAPLVLTWADRSRVVVGRDAFSVVVDPTEWDGGTDAVAQLDAAFADVPEVRVGRRRRVPQGTKPRTLSERFDRGAKDPFGVRKANNATQHPGVRITRLVALAWGLLCVVASFSDDNTSAERVQYLVMGVAFVVAVRLTALIRRPFRRPRSDDDAWLLDHADRHVEKHRVPDDLPASASAMVGGVLLGWLVRRGLVSDWFLRESGADLERWREGELTGPGLYREWDGVLASDMLNDEGRRFIVWYFSGEGVAQRFTRDIVALRGTSATSYHVPDTAGSQATFDELADRSYRAWKRPLLVRAIAAIAGPRTPKPKKAKKTKQQADSAA